MAYDNFKQPDNLSDASPNTFKFVLTRVPNMVYKVQRCDLPGITISGTQMYAGPMAHTDFTIPGEKVTYDPLNIGCILDEDFAGWLEIHNWMISAVKEPGKTLNKMSNLKNLSDATLLLNNNKFRANIAIKFYNIYPTNLGVVPLDYSVAPDTPITYDITFNYSHYEFQDLKTA